MKKALDYKLMILIALGIIFFFIYSFLALSNSAGIFTWPDETANYFFVKNYVAKSSLAVAEPLNELAGDLIKPRSFNVFNHNLVPGSFLGLLLLYGLIGKVISFGLVKFLTPFLAAIAGLFFYKIILKIFDEQIAFIATLLFYANPAWWYYANFSFLPNIAFLTFVIIGIYFLTAFKADKNDYWRTIGAAFFIFLALTIRTNEFIWVLGTVIILAIFYRQKIKWPQIILFCAIGGLVFALILYYNQMTYGNYLSFGYLRLEQGSGLSSQLPTEFQSSSSGFLNIVKFLILPFGFDALEILKNFYKYFIALFGWIFVPGLFGFIIFVKPKFTKEKLVYLITALSVGLYLVIYYGSWKFADPLTLHLNKIGISYVRYFLPIYILTLPFVALCFYHLVKWLKGKKIQIALAIILALCFLLLDIKAVYLVGEDNLLKVNQNINEYSQINQQVIGLTEDNAVIISQRSDKIFFPDRKVIGRWTDDEYQYWQALANSGAPLYYYAYESDEYITELNNKLSAYKLRLENGIEIKNNERLYKINLLAND